MNEQFQDMLVFSLKMVFPLLRLIDTSYRFREERVVPLLASSLPLVCDACFRNLTDWILSFEMPLTISTPNVSLD